MKLSITSLGTRIREEFFPRKDAFDNRGVETSGIVSLFRLQLKSRNKGSGVRYEPVTAAVFERAVRHVPKTLPFIDLGCGKGRALILAKECGFSNIVGVEFAPKLAKIARANLAKLNIGAQVVVSDATEFIFPTDPFVAFMYNPFAAPVMNRIIPKLKGYVVYINPLCKSEFAGTEIIHEEDSFVIYKV